MDNKKYTEDLMRKWYLLYIQQRYIVAQQHDLMMNYNKDNKFLDDWIDKLEETKKEKRFFSNLTFSSGYSESNVIFRTFEEMRWKGDNGNNKKSKKQKLQKRKK